MKENDKSKVTERCLSRETSTRQETRQKWINEIKKNFYTFYLKPIIRRMKISILVFCLAVIFGNISCKIYNNENVNLIEETIGKLYIIIYNFIQIILTYIIILKYLYSNIFNVEYLKYF